MPEIPSDQGKFSNIYRQSPFIIQATITGNKKIFNLIANQLDCSIHATGFIGFNKKRGMIIQNILGAAAFINSIELVSHIVSEYKIDKNFITQEVSDNFPYNVEIGKKKR